MRIKCPHCNGKGFSELNSALSMTCGWCMGQGELDLEIVPTEPHTEAEIEKKWEKTVWDTDVYLDDIDGKVPLTNEEWFCQLPTDEKAKVLETIIIKYLLLKQPKCYEITKREFWEMWLKQPHTDKE